MIPTDEHLFWSYRLAKFEVAGERRGVGRVRFAEFEQELDARLRSLRATGVTPDRIFRGVDPGRIWVRPKGVDRPAPSRRRGSLIVIPEEAHEHHITGMSVRILLEPTPEFATCEVLWLRAFGPALEQVLSPSCRGNRLDLRGSPPEIPRDGRRVFRYWARAYRAFRAGGTSAAKRLLAKGAACILAVLDLASYYDNIDASFLLLPTFVDEVSALARSSGVPFERSAYVAATAGLLDAYRRASDAVHRATGVHRQVGIPIGSLTARLIANLALAKLDRHVSAQPEVRHYARYVDDIVAVAEAADGVIVPIDHIVARFVPLDSARSTAKTLVLDAGRFGRPGSTFEVQSAKLRAFRLQGEEGLEYLGAVESEIERVSSDRRRFLEPWAAQIDHTVAASAQAEPIRALREADALSLRRFAVGTVCDKVLVASAMLGPDEARRFSREYLGKAARLATDWSRWIELVDVALRILGAALASGDEDTAQEVIDALLDRVRSLEAARGRRRIKIRWGKVTLRFRAALPLLRAWVEVQIHEAVCSAARFDDEGFLDGNMRSLAHGLAFTPLLTSATELLRCARLVGAADLRLHDAENDHATGTRRLPRPPEVVASIDQELSSDHQFMDRRQQIHSFVDACLAHGDELFSMSTAVDILLSPRPPTYTDILFRWIRATGNPDGLLSAVNAIRGTRYLNDAMGLSGRVLRVYPPPDSPWEFAAPDRSRVVLGNLCTEDAWWEASLTNPVLTAGRQARLARIVNQALDAARRARRDNVPTLLLLPELSLPRRWVRELLRHLSGAAPGMGLVAGLEYDVVAKRVYNEALAFLPRPFFASAGWIWTKRRPAHHEGPQLVEKGFSFDARGDQLRFCIMSSEHGEFLPLICSELLEVDTRSRLLGGVDMVLVPAWNKDVGSFEYFVHASTLELHSFVAVANNGLFSDCRARGPYGESWQRDACRLMSRGENEVVVADFPIGQLRAYRADPADYERRRKQWIDDTKANGGDPSKCPHPAWKPVPPGMHS